MNARQRDRLLAVAAGVFAASYVAAARGIEDSLLSDAVGAGGVPQGVGIAMGVAALALFVKSFAGAGGDAGGGEDDGLPSLRELLTRTLGLLLMLLAYGALLPWLGYPVCVTLLLLASGWLAGAPLRAPLLAMALLGGPGLWLLFHHVLQVRMPVGSLWGA